MKGRKCFGLLLALSIIFGLSLSVFSNDTNAWTLNQDVVPILESNGSTCRFLMNGSSWSDWISNANSPWLGNNTGLGWNSIDNIQCSHQSAAISPGEYVEFLVRVESQYLQVGTTSWNDIRYYSNVVRFEWLDDGRFRGLDAEQVGSTDNYNGRYEYWRFVVVADQTSNFVALPARFFNNTNINSAVLVSNWTTYKAKDGLSISDKEFLTTLLEQHSSDEVYQEIREMNDKDDQDRSDIQEQSSDTESSANDSQEDAQATGTTLLGAFSAFVNAMTSASPSNCNIDMDLGNLDLGVVNLCTLSLPAPFQALASIFLILFCVPLSIATARKVINLFRSFQG